MNGRHTILALALWSGASAIATATAQEAEGGNPVVRAYAQQTGISVTEAKRRLSREAEIVAMQRKLESEDDFAALKVVHSPEFKAVVLAKGDAPGLLRKHTTNPLFVGRQVPRGRKELEGARAASLRVLENLKAEFETDIDPEAGEVKILVTDASAARPALAAVIRNFPFVTITQVPDIARPVATFRGGQEILTSTDKCTTGFAVKNSANLQGFITAGHCTGPLTVQGITFSNPQAPAQYTGNHDQQWFARSGHIYSPTIFTGDTSTSTMTIKGIANPPLGWPLCKFGRTTRQTCGTVESISHAVRNADGTTGYWYRVKAYSDTPLISCDGRSGRYMTCGGDSGGPVWSSEGAAYGIVHARGGNGTVYEYDMFYQPSDRFAALGVSVLVGP